VRLLLALLALGSLGVGIAAPRAAFAKEPAAKPEDKAFRLFKEGRVLFETTDYAKALEKAEEAYDLFDHPAILILKGRCLEKLGRFTEALAAYKLLDLKDKRLKPDLREEAAAERKALEEKIQRGAKLIVESEQSDAEVQIDGAPAGRVPVERKLTPGQHTITVSKQGYRTETRTVTLKVGESTQVAVKLTADGSPVVVYVPGGLRGVQILFDATNLEIAMDEAVGQRTKPRPLAAGQHVLTCKKGEKVVQLPFTVVAGVDTEVTCPLDADAAPVPIRPILGWTGVGLGAFMAGVGTWALATYGADKEEAARRGLADSEWSSSKPTLGPVWLGVGLLGGAASWYFLVRQGASDTAVTDPAPALPAPVFAARRGLAVRF